MKLESVAGWAVVKAGKILYIHTTRGDARVRKMQLGGKENGVSIIQLVAKQEVR